MARARGECFQFTSEVADDGRTLSFKLVSSSGTLLRRQNDYAVGYHLFSAESIVIEGGATLVVDTGVGVSMSRGCYVRIFIAGCLRCPLSASLEMSSTGPLHAQSALWCTTLVVYSELLELVI